MRLKVTPKNSSVENLERALDEFARLSEETYKKTAEKWQNKLKYMPLSGGTAEFPELVFTWLPDEYDDKSRIFFISAKTPLIWKFFKLPKKKMEKELKSYLKDIHNIDAEVHFIGD